MRHSIFLATWQWRESAVKKKKSSKAATQKLQIITNNCSFETHCVISILLPGHNPVMIKGFKRQAGLKSLQLKKNLYRYTRVL